MNNNKIVNYSNTLTDSFSRKIDYLRVSITDHCNFRCIYCMGENVSFLPKKELLTLDEMDRLCSAFVARGVRRLRLTGGEPLMRRNALSLVRSLSRHLGSGALDEITLTTNGSMLARHAADLYEAGMRRINISLDTLDGDAFAAITRRGDLKDVLKGIDAAQAAGFALKLNMVAMRGLNDHEIEAMMLFAHGRDMDLTLIETMPLGAFGGDRRDYYLPLSEVRARLSEKYTLTDIADHTSGPAQYVRIAETGRRLGLITPLSHHFCGSCNRMRITCTGQLTLCLGQNASVDLRRPIRAEAADDLLNKAIDQALLQKPLGHTFSTNPASKPTVNRTMNVTGG